MNGVWDVDLVTSIEEWVLWFVLKSKSVDFTDVLRICLVVNRCVLMCYFIIIYGIFGGVRDNGLFIRVWGDFVVG